MSDATQEQATGIVPGTVWEPHGLFDLMVKPDDPTFVGQTRPPGGVEMADPFRAAVEQLAIQIFQFMQPAPLGLGLKYDDAFTRAAAMYFEWNTGTPSSPVWKTDQLAKAHAIIDAYGVQGFPAIPHASAGHPEGADLVTRVVPVTDPSGAVKATVQVTTSAKPDGTATATAALPGESWIGHALTVVVHGVENAEQAVVRAFRRFVLGESDA